MPYKTEWVDPELLLTHNGVSVYRTYRDDDIEDGKSDYWFTTDKLDNEGDDTRFDIRDLPNYTCKYSGEVIIKDAIELGYIKPFNE